MARRLSGTVAAAFLAGLAGAAAADCPPPVHVVAAGETVFTIAESQYGALDAWEVIYTANLERLPNPVEILPGTELSLPCLEEVVEEPTPPGPEMRLLTASNNAPFTDRDWPEQGMITELVRAALEETPAPVTFAIVWDDTLPGHLDALDAKDFDMGFPWARPDCARLPDHALCAAFHFSEPIVEVLSLLFVTESGGLSFEENSDLHGRTLCRPAGAPTFDLDTVERQWLTRDLITLVTPPTPEACFELLAGGEVDAVAVNEFTGWTVLTDLGLRDAVAPLPTPLGVEGLHVIISKQHWRGTTHLYRINAGLAALKESARYDEIVARHLGTFWERVK